MPEDFSSGTFHNIIAAIFHFSLYGTGKIVYNKENFGLQGVNRLACMKCGRKLGASKTFCDECLEKMNQCPVDPDAPVKLPNRPAEAAPVKKKQPNRRYFWVIEGENDTLRTKIRWLRFALTIAIIGFLLAVGLILMMVFWQDQLDEIIRFLHL